MPRPLVEDNPPIHEGPIVIDNWPLDSTIFSGMFVDHSTFVIEALSQELPPGKATLAMQLAVEGLIRHFDLGILPPFDAQDRPTPWGPYDAVAYHIGVEDYHDHANIIKDFAASKTEDPQVLAILERVHRYAAEELRLDRDKTPIDDLPGAFFTPTRPQKHIASGDALAIDDFQLAGHAVQTSSAKAAQVFDTVVDALGDREAQAKRAELDIYANSRSRVEIRQMLYIKVQAIVDFLESYDALSPDVQKQVGSIGLSVLRNIVYDEDRHAPAEPTP